MSTTRALSTAVLSLLLLTTVAVANDLDCECDAWKSWADSVVVNGEYVCSTSSDFCDRHDLLCPDPPTGNYGVVPGLYYTLGQFDPDNPCATVEQGHMFWHGLVYAINNNADFRVGLRWWGENPGDPVYFQKDCSDASGECTVAECCENPDCVCKTNTCGPTTTVGLCGTAIDLTECPGNNNCQVFEHPGVCGCEFPATLTSDFEKAEVFNKIEAQSCELPGDDNITLSLEVCSFLSFDRCRWPGGTGNFPFCGDRIIINENGPGCEDDEVQPICNYVSPNKTTGAHFEISHLNFLNATEDPIDACWRELPAPIAIKQEDIEERLHPHCQPFDGDNEQRFDCVNPYPECETP